MCRKVVFKGACPECSNIFTWDELSQELSCLEAKNNGVFGMCDRGTTLDEKAHDQECDVCLAVLGADEGYDGGTEEAAFAGWYGNKKDAADSEQVAGQHKNKKQRTA
ncbi:hypothetical protein BT67DRAFT_387150 [Trichocladium antarcticum]|uniref:Uncharacterized protein n=1 Tax=Trichocladium antarcticum TaxID=1450529 RepID=A0AAN6ZBR8_9PEZI|nr:hypothetical protein BT67DRAFT_387150 [Trichocladium antarcticum]